MKSKLTGKLLLSCRLALAFLAPVSAAARGGYQVLHSFSGDGDGSEPWDALIVDGSGNLYGTTPVGGANNRGTIFEVTPTGAEPLPG